MFSKKVQNTYELNPSGIENAITEAFAFMQTEGVDREVAISMRLSIEDALVSWLYHFPQGKTFSIIEGERWNKPYIGFVLEGEPFDPLSSGMDDDFGNFNSTLLPSLGLSPTYNYEFGKNILNYTLPFKKVKRVYKSLICLSLAIVMGILLRILLPERTLALFDRTYIQPICDMLLAGLRAVAGPFIFFSVIGGIIEMGDKDSFGKVGTKMIGGFLRTMAIIVLAFTVVALLLYHGPVNLFGNYSGFGAFVRMVFDMVPKDVISPFIDYNTIKIIVIAIIFGAASLALGSRVAHSNEFFSQMNEAIQTIFFWFGYLIPFFIFFLILNMILQDNFRVLLNSFGILLFYLVLMFALLAIRAYRISRKVNVSTFLLLKKVWPSIYVGISFVNFGALFNIGEKKFGINRSLCNMGLPVGNVIFTPATACFYLLLTFYFSSQYGVEISAIWLLYAFVSCFILSIATPSAVGGSLLCYSMVFGQVGIPSAAMTYAAALAIIFDILRMCLNNAYMLLELLSIANSMKMVDYEKLKSLD